MINNKCKISFIIPLYNAEKYITKCLDSIISANLNDDYEIIVVDDNSTDKGAEIVKKYCQKDNTIQYIFQQNQGSSVARNTGIERATGDYIWFVDSDDYLDSALLRNIKDDIIKNNYPDVFAIQLKLIENGNTRIECVQHKVKHNIILKGRDAVLNGYQPSSACATICRRTFLNKNKIRFYIGISHQDVEFTMRTIALAETTYFSDYKAYFYIKHHGSVSQPKTTEKQFFYTIGDLYVALSFQKFAKELEDYILADYILRWSNNMLVNLTLSLKQKKNALFTNEFTDRVLQEMRKYDAFPLHGPFLSWKISLLSKYLNICMA
ncbi:MAG: glycosyltransferase [Prevotella sp.]|nr:glycosyltransferase [Prevotella sp.]